MRSNHPLIWPEIRGFSRTDINGLMGSNGDHGPIKNPLTHGSGNGAMRPIRQIGENARRRRDGLSHGRTDVYDPRERPVRTEPGRSGRACQIRTFRAEAVTCC